jgi:hypothetical protein
MAERWAARNQYEVFRFHSRGSKSREPNELRSGGHPPMAGHDSARANVWSCTSANSGACVMVTAMNMNVRNAGSS